MIEPKHKNYRTCIDYRDHFSGKENDLTKLDKIYELNKYCLCDGCQRRLRYDREPSNGITVTTKDISKVDNIAEFLKDWTCKDGNRRLDTVYLKF